MGFKESKATNAPEASKILGANTEKAAVYPVLIMFLKTIRVLKIKLRDGGSANLLP